MSASGKLVSCRCWHAHAHRATATDDANNDNELDADECRKLVKEMLTEQQKFGKCSICCESLSRHFLRAAPKLIDMMLDSSIQVRGASHVLKLTECSPTVVARPAGRHELCALLLSCSDSMAIHSVSRRAQGCHTRSQGPNERRQVGISQGELVAVQSALLNT